jgi:hypothetical protein
MFYSIFYTTFVVTLWTLPVFVLVKPKMKIIHTKGCDNIIIGENRTCEIK